MHKILFVVKRVTDIMKHPVCRINYKETPLTLSATSKSLRIGILRGHRCGTDKTSCTKCERTMIQYDALGCTIVLSPQG